MAALDSAERAARTLLDHPVVFVGAAALGVLKLPVEATRTVRVALDVYGVLALLTFVFTPVLLAGVYGVAASALRDEAEPGAFWGGVGAGYVDLVLANVAYAVLQHLLLLFFSVVALVVFVLFAGGVGVVAGVVEDPGTAEDTYAAAGLLAVAGVVVVAVVYLAVRGLVAFHLQLYKPAAVLGDHGPLGAFRESVRLVRANVESTLAFVLVRLFATVLLVLPGVVAVVGVVVVDASVLRQLEGASAWVAVAAVLVVGFAVGVVELAFLATYRVAFYRSLVDA